MSSSLYVRPGQQFVYRLEIYQVFKPQTRQERIEGVERVRLNEPILVELGWYSTATAARNHGSYTCGTAKWYGNKGKPTTWRWDYSLHKSVGTVPDRGTEPEKDYKVFKVPVTLDMGEAVELPPLKRLYQYDLD